MPNNATSAGYRVGYVKETVFGTTPAATPLKLLRTTGGIGKVSVSSVESDELQLAEVTDLIRVGADGGGTINFELSYGALDDLLEGIFGAAWATNVLKVGTTKIGFTIEDQFTDITKFLAYKGCVIDGISISLQQGAKITGKITYKASVIPTASSGTTAGTGGPTAAPTNSIMSPIGSVQLLQEGGALDLKGVGLTALTIDLTRAAILQPQVGSLSPSDISAGQFVCKGSVSLYTPNTTLLDKYLGDTLTSLAVTLGGAASLKYALLMSKVRFADGGIQEVGKNQPVIQTFGYQAVYDATNSTLMATRTP